MHHCNLFQVCQELRAHALVDDSLENALACMAADPPVRVLLFGDTEWGTRRSVVNGLKRPGDLDGSIIQLGMAEGIDVTQMGFHERLRFEGGRRFWEEDAKAQESLACTRVRDWLAVVAWVEANVPGLAVEGVTMN
jgi:hypothetical protein